MSNVAIIFAGGTGQRMNTKTMPKQFLKLHGKPILLYTLEIFQENESIDGIILVSLESWIEYCRDLIAQYQLTKVKAVIAGGETGQHSICNGVERAASLFPEDSIVLIHDGVRPLVDNDTISAVIQCVKKNGTAITVTPASETIVTGTGKIHTILDRSACMMARAPQGFFLKDMRAAHLKAIQEARSFVDSASLMQYYGHDLYTVIGPVDNIKITTQEDFYMFRAMVDARENRQLNDIS